MVDLQIKKSDGVLENNIKIHGDLPSRYHGGKAGAGTYQTIINLIPPHDVYIETHLGGGAIMRLKKPAKKNIGIEINSLVCAIWRESAVDMDVINADAVEWLRDYPFNGDEFVYSDPPYLMETRKSGKMYDFEYKKEDHIKLLAILNSLPCMVMISGYWSDLYANELKGWNVRHFEVITRSGTMATEYLWFNYPDPTRLHEYSFLGDSFRERERIKRKRKRWVNRIRRLSRLEQNALFEELRDLIISPFLR